MTVNKFIVENVRRSLGIVFIYLFLFVTAANGSFAYSSADVKRGEELVALKDYTKAIELLSGMIKDYDFCAVNPADAARFGMLLCDSYEATGEGKSDACIAAAESTKLALIQAWASFKKQVPDVRMRLRKMAELCREHPSQFSDFIKTNMPKLVTSSKKTEAVTYLDAALAEIKGMEGASLIRGEEDAELSYVIGKQYCACDSQQKALTVVGDAVKAFPRESRTRCGAMLFLAECQLACSKNDDAVVTYKSVIADYPEDPGAVESLWSLFELLRAQQRYDEAIKYADELCSKECMLKPFAMWVRGSSYLALAKYKDAIDTLAAVRKDYPNDEAARLAFNTLVNAYVASGDIKQAAAVIKAQIKKDKSTEDIASKLNWLGAIYFQSADYASAKHCFIQEKNLANASDEIVTRAAYQLALCEWLDGKKEVARNLLKNIFSKPCSDRWKKTAESKLTEWATDDSEER